MHAGRTSPPGARARLALGEQPLWRGPADPGLDGVERGDPAQAPDWSENARFGDRPTTPDAPETSSSTPRSTALTTPEAGMPNLETL